MQKITQIKIENYTYYVYKFEDMLGKWEIILVPANQKYKKSDDASSDIQHEWYEYSNGGRIYRMAVDKAKELRTQLRAKEIDVPYCNN